MDIGDVERFGTDPDPGRTTTGIAGDLQPLAEDTALNSDLMQEKLTNDQHLLQRSGNSHGSAAAHNLPSQRLPPEGAPVPTSGPSGPETLMWTFRTLSVASATPHQQGEKNSTINPVILKIESIFESFCDVMLEDRQELTVPMKTTSRASNNQTLDAETGAIRSDPTIQAIDVCFPGKSVGEAWRFTVLVRILELIHEALMHNVTTTKRDIYYKDPSLFGDQRVVDRCVDDIACTFDVQRSSLNVVAAAKGLMVGCFKFGGKDGTVIHGSLAEEGMLVPNVQEIQWIRLIDVKWILVIEKEATFRTLAVNGFYKTSAAGNGILLTGKGYPDILTRAFLRRLSTITLQSNQVRTPIFALLDFDPYGVAILSTYKHGSINLAHENAHINVPSIRWLGLKSADLCAGDSAQDEQCLLGLTAKDRRLAVKMLGRPIFAEDGPGKEWRRELQVMLMLNMKAEIQLLSGREGGLENWLEKKLLTELGPGPIKSDIVAG
ncbi:MAG: hypothetical protein M1830_010164 [Pleopsidium flavum]|nr:MAG: hypothetical protein M1830_010164 [Pleopsidium flavum]